jgi:uncharacterized protein
LYGSIFNKADAHIKIVKTLAKYNYGLSRTDLLNKAKISNSGGGSKILKDLTDVGYLDYMIPFGNRANSGKYILADFYSRFYVHFIANDKIQNWLTTSLSSVYKVWCGISFELLCHYHKNEIAQALGIAGVFADTSYLHIKNEDKKISAQIDMLITRADNAVNLCEIKFSSDVYKITHQEAEKIQRKISYLQTKLNKKQYIFPTIITTYGCAKNQHYLSIIYNQVLLEDLFLAINIIKT